MKKFICRRCGRCCTDIGGRFSEDESRRIEEAFQTLEKYGLYLAIPPERFSIPLSPEEKILMEKLSREKGVNFNPVPKLILVNTEGIVKVIEWDLGSRRCPFYSEKKSCIIYRYRPLACKSFPVIMEADGFKLLDLCPETKKFSPDEIETAFEKECLHARKFSERVESIKKRIMESQKN